MSKKDSTQQMMMAAVAVNTAINAADCFGLLPIRGNKLNISGTAKVGCLETHEISLHSKEEKALVVKDGTTEYMRFDTKNKKVVIFKDSEHVGNHTHTGSIEVKAGKGPASGTVKSVKSEATEANFDSADIKKFTNTPSFENDLTVENTANDAKGSVINMRNKRGENNDGKDDDVLGEIKFYGNDDAAVAATSSAAAKKANDTHYASIRARVSDASDNAEDGEIALRVLNQGATTGPVDVLT